MSNRIWGEIVQLSGVLLLGGGMTMEVVKGGDIWLLCITLGCVIFTIGTKVKGN